MKNITILSKNIYFIYAIENMLNKIKKDKRISNLDSLIISDDIKKLAEQYAEDLDKLNVILFVKNRHEMAIINHFNFKFITLTMEDKTCMIESSISRYLVDLCRKMRMTHFANLNNSQIWLTKRELDVLMLSCGNIKIENIANKLKVTQKSILNYRAMALKKIGSNLSLSLFNFITSINKLQAKII